MFLIGWFIVIPILIDSCTIDEFQSRQIHHQVIFIGRILSLHRWSLDYPYSAFVWVSRVFQGEHHLLEHYQWTQLQRPLYVIVDQIESCSDGTQLKYYDEKIFAVRLTHARFYSNIPPLPITLANVKFLDAADQQYHDKSRKCLRVVLILVGIIICFAAIFLAAVIYRTWKTGLQKKNSTEFESNSTELNFNQSSSELRSHQTCLYGHVECLFDATCTEHNQCECRFPCHQNESPVESQSNDLNNSNQCRMKQARCEAYYQPASLQSETSACSSIHCSHGSKCLIDHNGSTRCYCPDDCKEYTGGISVEGRVCGSDNYTYENICDLQKRACQYQQNLSVTYLGECGCRDGTCLSHGNDCQNYQSCSLEYRPVCAANFQEYFNECEMNRYACQFQIRLSKLYDGPCDVYEKQQQTEVCKALICFNGKTCTIEDGAGVCRCLFNCTSDRTSVCGSDGILYQNLCELERARCIQEVALVEVDPTYCLSTCDPTQCPHGRCQLSTNGRMECQCISCPSPQSDDEVICGSNGVTYPSLCHLEYDACTRVLNIQAIHMGSCNNCHNVTCPFHAQCRSEQGTYSCICPSKSTCLPSRNEESYTICASNQQLFSSQCEMNIRSCELKTYLYAIAPHHCIAHSNESEYTRDCGFDEPLLDLTFNQTVECDALGRCPINSFCNVPTNRCCTKVITAILPYQRCINNEQCGKNMICLGGLCECERQDFVPARKKRECIAVPQLTTGTSCWDSPYGCCHDNVTISPSIDRQGCPEYCNCHSTGSLQSSCDPVTGACYCRPAVGGSSCSHCENEYWGFSRIITHNNTGCTPCGCHPYGSTRNDCQQNTGECSCKPYTTGRQCDRCLNSSLTLTERGCVNLNKSRRRPRTCRDLNCLFEGVCQVVSGQPRCTCFHVLCTPEEQRPMNICASDGHTYRSRCAIKRQQCLKQYEIGLIYPGVCTAMESMAKEYSLYEEEFSPPEEEVGLDDSVPLVPLDSKRCRTNDDCGENMVCLSEFCECAKQKFKRIPGPRCVAPHSNPLSSNYSLNPVRRTTMGACLRRTPCENQATCLDRPDGNYKCLCAFGWQGRHCNEKFEVTIPHFNRQSYFELKPPMTGKNSENQLLRLDIIFASEHPNGLLLYADDKLTEFYFIISIRNHIIDITVRLDHFISTIQLPEMIELDIYSRLQVQILNTEIRARLNDGNISTRSIPFGNAFKSNLYLGGLPDSLNSLYQQFHLDEGFQGCIHELKVNERHVIFNSSEHHIILSAQNIEECFANPCRSGIAACPNGSRCSPIRNNDANTYRCICDDYLSSLSSSGLSSSQTECVTSSIDRCSLKPCGETHQCINVYPNNYTCICSNCSSNRHFIAGFHTTSFIKRPPLQPIEHGGKFILELWFLTETPSGSLIYSDHANPRKGFLTIFIQRRLVIFNLMIGSKIISLSSRYPIELNKWHRCFLEIHGQKLTLVVDQEPPVITYEIFSSNLLWPRSFTFVGNLPIQYRSFDMIPNSIVLDGFRGAIQKIILNNHPLNDVRQDSFELFNITSFTGYPCQPNPCLIHEMCVHNDLNNYTCQLRDSQIDKTDSSLELDGQTHLIYSYIPANLNRNYFKLIFRTKNSHGLIFYIGDTMRIFSQYLSLTIVNGFIQFTAKIDRNESEVSLVSKTRVDDGQWHRVEVERFRRRITMKLDENYPRRAVSISKQTEFHPTTSSMYLGGYHRLCGYDEQHCRTFRGCLKEFFLDKSFLDLIKDEINQKYSLKSCHEQRSAG